MGASFQNTTFKKINKNIVFYIWDFKQNFIYKNN